MAWWLFKPEKKVGLVLGGGVARGIAHVGVLKVLSQYKVPIDYIVGTSSGSLVGAIFASGLSVSVVEEIAKRIRWRALLKVTFFQPGFIAPQAIVDFVEKYIGPKDFSDLKIPFAAVATDIRTGERVVIKEGSVAKAISASTCFPGFFAPVEYQGRTLVDGGIAANVPVDTAREMGAEFVIASDVVPSKYLHNKPHDPVTSIGQSLDLMLSRLSEAEKNRADIVINLQMEDEDIWHLDLNKAEKLIAAGELAAHRAIGKIKRALKLKAAS